MSKRRSNTIKLNKPMPSTRKDKKLMVLVRNSKTGRINTIHFGQKGFRHNHSKKARERFLKRSAGIRDAKGRLTKDNPLSANFWARKVLWGFRKRK